MKHNGKTTISQMDDAVILITDYHINRSYLSSASRNTNMRDRKNVI
jgi:hypothetical protein